MRLDQKGFHSHIILRFSEEILILIQKKKRIRRDGSLITVWKNLYDVKKKKTTTHDKAYMMHAVR